MKLVFGLVALTVATAFVGCGSEQYKSNGLGSADEAKLSTAKVQISTFLSCLELYALQIGNYPTTEQGLMALIVEPPGLPTKDDEDLAEWNGPYLEGRLDIPDPNSNSIKPMPPTVPRDPWGNEYQYLFPGAHNGEESYDIWSFGPDGVDGTEDDVIHW
jgi:general secretion pathway protein G